MESFIKSIPDSELKVMMIIWSNSKKMSTGEIFSELKSETEWKLSTLQIILTRLTEKGFLRNEKIGRFNYYYALIDESKYKKFETHNFIKKMYDNSRKRLIASLIEDDNSLSDEDIEQIRAILNKGGV